MNIKLNLAFVCIAALLASPTSPVRADELADKGREIFKNNQRAVVTVQVVMKTKYSMGGMGAQDNESKQDLTGTVVDPSGLTVLALSSTDPGSMLQCKVQTRNRIGRREDSARRRNGTARGGSFA